MTYIYVAQGKGDLSACVKRDSALKMSHISMRFQYLTDCSPNPASSSFLGKKNATAYPRDGHLPVCSHLPRVVSAGGDEVVGNNTWPTQLNCLSIDMVSLKFESYFPMRLLQFDRFLMCDYFYDVLQMLLMVKYQQWE